MMPPALFWSLRAARNHLRIMPRQVRESSAAWRRFWRSYRTYQRLAPADRRAQPRFLIPCFGDDTAETQIEPVYFYQDAWAFEKIVQQSPLEHIDVGSHHKFVALLSKVLPVTMVDIRPLSLPMASIRFQAGSILSLPFDTASVVSLSSICVVEHIGLGRYGDPLDPFGTEKALAELKRVVAPGGNLYLSLPLDDEDRVYFNAQRAFTEESLEKLVAPFEILERRYIYGSEFLTERRAGFGTDCYHLRRAQ